MAKRRAYSNLREVLGRGMPWRVASRLPGPELRAAWGRAVGQEIALRAWPVCLEQEGVLVVAVRGAVWKQELSLMTPQVLEALAREGQAVGQIKLVSARSLPQPPPPPPPPRELGPLDEAAVEAQVAGVADPELRQALASLMRAQLRYGGERD